MVLHNAVQVHQLAIDVVEDFCRRRLRPHEEQRSTASEDLNVAFMRRKKRDETISEATFAAHPGNDGGLIHCVSKPYGKKKPALDSLCFVHEAGALAGLAGNSCGFGVQLGCWRIRADRFFMLENEGFVDDDCLNLCIGNV